MSLLLEIAHCDLVGKCLTDKTFRNGCATIVRSQPSKTLEEHRLPEPWRGHLETAPILFVSSNPSIGSNETEGSPDPRGKDSDAYITDYFDNSFDSHIPARDFNGVRYWTGVRARASELLARTAIEGYDFALTEVVHCKSRQEIGVDEAVGECTRRWLGRVLEQSGARVIVVMGKYAEAAMRSHLQIRSVAKLWGPRRIGTISRYVAFLPHTNHRGLRTFAACLPNDLATLQAWLRRA
jgi:hypothetical protein